VQRGGHGLVHRLPGLPRLVRAAAQHAHAFALFGQVDEGEVGGERLDDPARLGQRQRLDAGEQAGPGAGVTAAVRLGQAAHVFDEVVERPTLLLDDRLAQKIAQQVDLLGKQVARGHARPQRPGRYSRARLARISASSNQTGFSSRRANSGAWSA
jgi:hypothetical protein